MNARAVIDLAAGETSPDVYETESGYFAAGEIVVDGERFYVNVSKRDPRPDGLPEGVPLDLAVGVYVTHPKPAAPVNLALAGDDGDTLAITLPDGRIVDLTMAVREPA